MITTMVTHMHDKKQIDGSPALEGNMQNLREICLRAFQRAVDSVQPYQRVFDTLRIVDNKLTIGARTYEVDRNIHLAAFGKAALGMVRGAEAALNGHIVDGLASVPRGTIQKITERNLRTKFLEGATNNLPDEDSCRNALMIAEMARKLQSPNDIFLVLISGGGSALLSAPLNAITLSEKCQTIKTMTSKGAEIKQLNAVRQAISKLKGGKLAQIASPAKIISLIISDIVGDPLEYIASGPTVLTPTGNPTAVLKELKVWNLVPNSVQEELLKSRSVENNQYVDVQNVIISNNSLALSSVKETIQNAGYQCSVLSNTITGDANEYGEKLSNLIESYANGKSLYDSLALAGLPPCEQSIDSDKIALLLGGECTVKVRGEGKGGRNQQIVMVVFSKLFEKWNGKKLDFALLSGGTDGQDGPTNAAGAVLTSEDLRFSANNSLSIESDIQRFLDNNDSYNFWKSFRSGCAHIICGSTGTNVMDLQILLLDRLH